MRKTDVLARTFPVCLGLKHRSSASQGRKRNYTFVCKQQPAAGCGFCCLFPPTSKMCSTRWTQFLTTHLTSRGFKEHDQKLPRMSNIEVSWGMKGPEATCCTKPSISAQYTSRTAIRCWAKEFGQVGDNFRGTLHESSMCCLTAGPPVLALLSSSLWTLFCRSFSNHFWSPLSPLQPLWCEPHTLLLVLPLRAECRNVISLSVFPPGQLFFCKVRPWGGAACACFVSHQRNNGVKQLMEDFLFLLNIRLSCDLGGVLTLCLDLSGCGGSNCTVGCSYAIVVMPLSVPLLVDQECISGCLSYFWSDNSSTVGQARYLIQAVCLLCQDALLTCWWVLSPGRTI